MNKTLVAVPSSAPGGLDAEISEHFGHCDVFTLVEIDDGKVSRVAVLPNGSHEHGGCMAPVGLLAESRVKILIADGMGMRPLAGFNQVGIDVYKNDDAMKVGQAIQSFLSGSMAKFSSEASCASHAEGECCGG